MMRTLTATIAALSLAAAMAAAQAPPTPQTPQTPQTPPTPQTPKPATEPAGTQAQAKNLMQDVTKIGCLKAWQPGPVDAARGGEPPKMGTYVLVPISADPVRATVDLPTYVLVGGTVNLSVHENHKVEISGIEQTAQLPPTVQETVTAPTMKPENKPDMRSMPSLTVRGLKMVSATCS